MAGDVKRWTEKCFEFRGQMNNGFLSFLLLRCGWQTTRQMDGGFAAINNEAFLAYSLRVLHRRRIDMEIIHIAEAKCCCWFRIFCSVARSHSPAIYGTRMNAAILYMCQLQYIRMHITRNIVCCKPGFSEFV